MADYTPDPAVVELVAQTLWDQFGGPSTLPTPVWYDDARAVLSALAAAGRLRPGPLLGVRTYDGRVYAPQDVELVYTIPPTEETP